MRIEDTNFLEQLQSLARVESSEVVRTELESVRVEDLADALARLPLEDGLSVLQKLEDNVAADVLVEFPTETARAFVRELSDSALAHYLDILPMDDALELREELGADRFDALLNIIPVEDAQEIRRLMEYPEGSVGRLLTESFFEVAPDSTMERLLADIRMAPEGKYEQVNDLYVLDGSRHLLGVLSLRRAIRAQPDQTAEQIMYREVVACEAREPAEEAARRMSRYGFYALPVLDGRGRMVGLFTGDDAQEILEEAATEDVLKLGAVSGDAESYMSLNAFQLARRRVWWLLALFVAETLTGSVLRHYGQGGGEDLGISPLMFFVPLLIGAGGNAGSQVTTTITRALAVGDVSTRDWLKVFQKEIVVASLIGLTLGIIGFGRALIWGTDWHLSLTVAIALPAIVIWATALGSMLPLAAKRLGIDPAVMSAPFITTFVDATGLIIYFELARLLFIR